jgi:hypothetical protein
MKYIDDITHAEAKIINMQKRTIVYGNKKTAVLQEKSVRRDLSKYKRQEAPGLNHPDQQTAQTSTRRLPQEINSIRGVCHILCFNFQLQNSNAKRGALRLKSSPRSARAPRGPHTYSDLKRLQLPQLLNC